ncbi:MAG: Hsp20/alpha crystallin family protein [Haloferacaceae archaeon]
MALLRNNASWVRGADDSPQTLGIGGTDYELYEEEDAFVLAVEMPGFDPEQIDVGWDDGVLNVSAEHADDDRGSRRSYYRRFRFPKDVDDDGIEASYTNGILEVTLPVETGAGARGKRIEVEG